jgi:hypothetical protein
MVFGIDQYAFLHSRLLNGSEFYDLPVFSKCSPMWCTITCDTAAQRGVESCEGPNLARFCCIPPPLSPRAVAHRALVLCRPFFTPSHQQWQHCGVDSLQSWNSARLCTWRPTLLPRHPAHLRSGHRSRPRHHRDRDHRRFQLRLRP